MKKQKVELKNCAPCQGCGEPCVKQHLIPCDNGRKLCPPCTLKAWEKKEANKARNINQQFEGFDGLYECMDEILCNQTPNCQCDWCKLQREVGRAA